MKIGMVSLGCPKNLVDSEVMLGLAQQSGHQLTRDAATPTCSSSTPAPSSTRRSRNRSTRFSDGRAEKDRKVAGASWSRAACRALRDELKAQIPEIDACSGPAKVR